ncbi:MAG: Stp1/IreP family PP2C-type Ser/Thr phosphatase [Myxococcales bacterium]|nr:Stp1/IreP family PP2C-type Ser/Thr phosphatase [Myxococcales bacterium]
MTERPRQEPSSLETDDPPDSDGAGREARVATSDYPEIVATTDPPLQEPADDTEEPGEIDHDAETRPMARKGKVKKKKSKAKRKAQAKKTSSDIVVTFFGKTDVGQIREHNEDNFLVADLTSRVRGIGGSPQTMTVGDGGLLLAVCDGMGGAAAGEVASQMATDVIYDNMLGAAGHHERDRLAVDIVEALEDAGSRILAEANANRACRGMGTTATVAALVDDHLLLGQVGDSRAYVLRKGRLVQVTRDQSLVNQLIEAGQLTEEEAENFEHSNIILQALGTADAVQVDLTYVKLRRGDVLMMCSDGLSGMIRDGEILDTLMHVEETDQACQVLIDDANQAGGHDNITVIVARFDGEGLEPPSDEDVSQLKYDKYALPAWIGDRDDPRAFGNRSGGKSDDDTPLIEITGEFEIDPNTPWEELLDDRPVIPREPGPGMSNVVIFVAVAVLVFALYYLIAR